MTRLLISKGKLLIKPDFGTGAGDLVDRFQGRTKRGLDQEARSLLRQLES